MNAAIHLFALGAGLLAIAATVHAFRTYGPAWRQFIRETEQ